LPGRWTGGLSPAGPIPTPPTSHCLTYTQKPHKATILHVDGDPNDIFLLHRAFELEQVSHPLQSVGDGEVAIAYLAGEGYLADRQKYPLPGLVLLELNVPKVSGLHVLAWVRTHRALKALPVAILTSEYRAEDVALAYHLGVNAFIAKPSTYDELREVVRFLKGWVQHTIPPPTDEQAWIALKTDGLEERWPQLRSQAA